MEAAALPLNEKDRLKALQGSNLLDSPPVHVLDEAVMGLAAYYEVPIVLISLVDEHRQWFKAKWGLDASETPREWAFCGYTILEENEFVVPDTHSDSRFADNPLVTADPSIRFYAGSPLSIDGGPPLGTVCLIDDQPHLEALDLGQLHRATRSIEHYLKKHSQEDVVSQRPHLQTVKSTIEVLDEYCVISIRNDLRADGANLWFTAISRDPILARARKIAIDMSECPFVDSSGIGTLVKLLKACGEQSRHLELRSLQPAVALLLNRLKLDKVFVIA